MHVEVMDCPESGYMCEDPGLLLCVGELNDCSGRGDCYKGSCYCHGGWGGADCSVGACLSSIGCEDVRPILQLLSVCIYSTVRSYRT